MDNASDNDDLEITVKLVLIPFSVGEIELDLSFGLVYFSIVSRKKRLPKVFYCTLVLGSFS